MAAPSDLTATLLVTEAFYKAGKMSPTTAEKTRATDYFLEEIKNEIWTRPQVTRFGPAGDTRLKTLQTSEVQVLTANKSKYSFATDFDEELTLTLLDGTHTGTAQAGGATSITLAADEDATDVEGRYILVTGGTGAAGFRQCIDYNSTTKVATVDAAWATNPDATSTYMVVDTYDELEEESTYDISGIGQSFSPGSPSSFSKIDEAGVTKFILDVPADKSYGLLIRYYANIHKIDLSSALITKVYNNWRSTLVTGVAWKIAESEDDNRYAAFKAEYEQNLNNLILKELPYGGEFGGFTV